MFASERHTSIHLDDRGGLHNLSGPALAYSDGWELWALHGVVVRKELVQNLGKMTPDEIATEKNVELRRVLIETFGLARFLRESAAKKCMMTSGAPCGGWTSRVKNRWSW